MHNYETVTEALRDLKARGFERDFNIAFDKLVCRTTDLSLNPEDFEIVEVHRFEGETNPSDEDVVYALESKDGKAKGVITTAYGANADDIAPELLSKLTIHREE